MKRMSIVDRGIAKSFEPRAAVPPWPMSLRLLHGEAGTIVTTDVDGV